MAVCVHENKFIMLAKVNDEIYAVDDIWMHQEARLHEEELGAQKNNSNLVICPWHAVHFDLRRGKVFQGTLWATNKRPMRSRYRETTYI